MEIYMGTSVESSTPTASATVILGDGAAIAQPQNFQLCPLGLQYYAPKPIDECCIIDFDLDLPGNNQEAERIQCSGIVAHCREEEAQSMYRIWVKFLDLPERAKERIKCVACDSNLLCPFCENF